MVDDNMSKINNLKHMLAVIGVLCIIGVFTSAVAKTVTGKKVFICETNATSSLGDKYKPLYAFDGNLNTCWAEGADGHGIGETLVISSGPWYQFDVKEIRIFPGYGKSEELFFKNSHIKKMEIVVFTYNSKVGSKKIKSIITFDDKPEFKTIPINQKNVYKIYCKSLEVYKGSKWDDTCISEIEIVSDQIQLVDKQWAETDIIGKETYTRAHMMHFETGNILNGTFRHYRKEKPEIEGTWKINKSSLILKYFEKSLSEKEGPFEKELIFKGYIQKGDEKRVLLYGEEFLDEIANSGL